MTTEELELALNYRRLQEAFYEPKHSRGTSTSNDISVSANSNSVNDSRAGSNDLTNVVPVSINSNPLRTTNLIGEIATLRKTNNLTLRAIADLSGIPRTSYWEMEKGIRTKFSETETTKLNNLYKTLTKTTVPVVTSTKVTKTTETLKSTTHDARALVKDFLNNKVTASVDIIRGSTKRVEAVTFWSRNNNVLNLAIRTYNGTGEYQGGQSIATLAFGTTLTVDLHNVKNAQGLFDLVKSELVLMNINLPTNSNSNSSSVMVKIPRATKV